MGLRGGLPPTIGSCSTGREVRGNGGVISKTEQPADMQQDNMLRQLRSRSSVSSGPPQHLEPKELRRASLHQDHPLEAPQKWRMSPKLFLPSKSETMSNNLLIDPDIMAVNVRKNQENDLSSRLVITE